MGGGGGEVSNRWDDNYQFLFSLLIFIFTQFLLHSLTRDNANAQAEEKLSELNENCSYSEVRGWTGGGGGKSEHIVIVEVKKGIIFSGRIAIVPTIPFLDKSSINMDIVRSFSDLRKSLPNYHSAAHFRVATQGRNQSSKGKEYDGRGNEYCREGTNHDRII